MPPSYSAANGKNETMASIADAFLIALDHHQAGRLAEAEALYSRILEAAPGMALAHYYSGIVAASTGRLILAAERLKMALSADATLMDAHYNLGVVLATLGDTEAARRCHRRAVALDPAYVHALTNSGLATRSMVLLKAVVTLRPEWGEGWFNFGTVLYETGKRGEALTIFQTALDRNPDLAAARRASERIRSEFERDRLVVEGFAALERGQADEASFRAVLRADPAHRWARVGLGMALQRRQSFEEAADQFRILAALCPDEPTAEIAAAALESERAHYAAMIPHTKRAALLQPGNAQTVLSHAEALLAIGRLDEAIAAVRRGTALDPDDMAIRDKLLFMLLASPDIDNAQLFSEVQDFNAVFGRTHPHPPHANRRDPDKPLNIGYVSGTIRESHNMLYVLEPLLAGHNHGQFRTYVYHDVPASDPLRQRLGDCVAGWCDTTAMSDEDAAERIRADGVDILISVHGRGSMAPRMGIFTRKPAPIQVAFQHVMTTGLDAMDYWLTDAMIHPRDTTERFLERLIHLPHYCRYRPPQTSPDVAPLPMKATGRATFACFSSRWKINDSVMALWARVLASVPESRLFLKGDGFDDAGVQAYYLERFARHGVGSGSVMFRGADRDYVRHLGRYEEADVALDTFPYSYGNTAFEALWMGVPVVTLAGGRIVGRMATSILSAAGLPEWIASNGDEYIAKAVALVRDTEALASCRYSLRRRVAESRLMNAPLYGHHVEQALRWMWKKWCFTP